MDSKVTDLTKGVYRRVYAGFIKGQRINQMSLAAEAWFWRVYASADDFGNAEADPHLCWVATVGKRTHVTPKQVAAWLVEMEKSRLIQMYLGANNEKYLHINDFEELQPSGRNGKKVRRFPSFENPDESRLIQNKPEIQNAPHSDSHSHSDTEDKTTLRVERPPRTPRAKIPVEADADPVKIYHKLTGRNPKPAERDAIRAEVSDPDHWREVVTKMVLEKHERVDWALERYRGEYRARGSPAEVDFESPKAPLTLELIAIAEGCTVEEARKLWNKKPDDTDSRTAA